MYYFSRLLESRFAQHDDFPRQIKISDTYIWRVHALALYRNGKKMKKNVFS